MVWDWKHQNCTLALVSHVLSSTCPMQYKEIIILVFQHHIFWKLLLKRIYLKLHIILYNVAEMNSTDIDTTKFWQKFIEMCNVVTHQNQIE